MTTFNQNIIKHKAGLLNLTAELRNISKACRIMGFDNVQKVSHILFGHHQRRWPYLSADVCGHLLQMGCGKALYHQDAITGADLLNDRILPFFTEQKMGIIRMLTDRGTEYCGKVETHNYELYLGVNNIEHTKTKARHPQTNGICERFHKTILQEFYQVAFRRKLYHALEELQADLDEWTDHYNTERTHQGKICCGRTPMQTLRDGKQLWIEKGVQLN